MSRTFTLAVSSNNLSVSTALTAIAEAGNVAVTYKDAKGNTKQRTIEAAVIGGGRSLAAVKDELLISAFNKALSGRYTAAAEILGLGFSGAYRQIEKNMGNPGGNKRNMTALLGWVGTAIREAEIKAGDKGLTGHKARARTLRNALIRSDAFKAEFAEEIGEVVSEQ